MTNLYPNYVNTGMIEGFSPRLRMVVPLLEPQYVADRIYQAIMAEEKEVYIQTAMYFLKIFLAILPLHARHQSSEWLVGSGMDQFKGRFSKAKTL